MTDYLLLAFVFLGAGVAAVPLATRFGLGSVLGYLLAGVLIAPLLNALHVDVEAVQHFAELGVVFMLFLVGLELEPRRLWEMRMRLLGLGGLQLVGTAAALGGVALVLGERASIATAVGLVLALSSTAIALQTLTEKGLLASDGGRSSFAVLLFQDIAVIPMLALLPLLAIPGLAPPATGTPEDAEHGLSLVAGLPAWQAALITLAAIAAVIFGGSRLTAPVFRFISVARLRELFTATALALVIGIALLMSLVGLSPALGTFLAGVVLANSEYRHELKADIDPFRGLLLGVFFITVGASIRFDLLLADPSAIVAALLLVMIVKAAVLFVIGLLFGLRGSDRWLFALGLAQVGEFAFVLLSLTVADGVLPAELADRLSLVVALSMLLTPLLFILHDRVILPRFAAVQERRMDEIRERADIIIAGHGRFGGIVNRLLRGAGHSTIVVDYSSQQLETLRAFGVRLYFGDATRPDLLSAAGIDTAKMLIVAIDGREQITELVRYVVKNYPHIHVIARAKDRHHVYDLWSAGCRDIIRELYDGSIRAGRSALEALGEPRETAEQRARAFEAMDRKFMVELADLYDSEIPTHENEPYVAKVRQMLADWEANVGDTKTPPPEVREGRG